MSFTEHWHGTPVRSEGFPDWANPQDVLRSNLSACPPRVGSTDFRYGLACSVLIPALYGKAQAPGNYDGLVCSHICRRCRRRAVGTGACICRLFRTPPLLPPPAGSRRICQGSWCGGCAAEKNIFWSTQKRENPLPKNSELTFFFRFSSVSPAGPLHANERLCRRRRPGRPLPYAWPRCDLTPPPPPPPLPPSQARNDLLPVCLPPCIGNRRLVPLVTTRGLSRPSGPCAVTWPGTTQQSAGCAPLCTRLGAYSLGFAPK